MIEVSEDKYSLQHFISLLHNVQEKLCRAEITFLPMQLPTHHWGCHQQA